MATRTVVCPECESPLAPGRFSCSSCGALVASVATVARSFNEPEILSQVERQPEVAPEPRSVKELIAAADDGWDEVRDEIDVPPTNGHGTDEVADDRPLASAMTLEPDEITEPAEPDDVAEATASAGLDEPAWPDHPTWPLPTVDPRTPPAVLGVVASPDDEAGPASVDEGPAMPPDGVDTASARVPAGVYLPPSAVLPPGEALPLPGSVVATAPVPEATSASRAAGGPLAGLSASLKSLAVPADAGARTIAIGGGLAVLGFLLPWAGIVIGSRSLDGGLFSTWGLAGPAAPLAFLLVLGLTALAVLRSNLPGWIGLSTPAIALAALLVGILWPYLFGSFGAAIGVYVVAAGAFVLLAGGLVQRVASRHDDTTAGV